MKRCCLERKASYDILIEIAHLYDGLDICTLSEKESQILNLFVANGIGKVYNVYDVESATLKTYYKFKPM